MSLMSRTLQLFFNTRSLQSKCKSLSPSLHNLACSPVNMLQPRLLPCLPLKPSSFNAQQTASFSTSNVIFDVCELTHKR